MFRTFLSVILAAASALAQSPAFEVAAIKPSVPIDVQLQKGMAHTGVTIDKLGLDAGFQSLQDIICRAFSVNIFQVAGPDWLPSGHFDIRAKMPEGADAADALKMLQTLLAQRFHMQFHRESREVSVFDLSVARGGAKLIPAGDQPAPTRMTALSTGVSRMERTTNMSGLAALLTRFMSRPVYDKTELTGDYQVVIDIPMVSAANASAERSESPEDRTNALLLSLQQMGLKLDSRKTPTETIVIDHIEKVPTEN